MEDSRRFGSMGSIWLMEGKKTVFSLGCVWIWYGSLLKQWNSCIPADIRPKRSYLIENTGTGNNTYYRQSPVTHSNIFIQLIFSI